MSYVEALQLWKRENGCCYCAIEVVAQLRLKCRTAAFGVRRELARLCAIRSEVSWKWRGVGIGNEKVRGGERKR